jgi:hypothetical protein
MAKVSKRFENPGGRIVPRVPAEVSSYSTWFAGPGGTLEASGTIGIGFDVRVNDSGQTVRVFLTFAELAALNAQAAHFAAEYPPAEPKL